MQLLLYNSNSRLIMVVTDLPTSLCYKKDTLLLLNFEDKSTTWGDAVRGSTHRLGLIVYTLGLQACSLGCTHMHFICM